MNTLEGLYTLLAHNVYGDKQLKPRWIGFRAELELGPILSKRAKVSHTLKGGMFVPRQEDSSALENSIYFTIIKKSESRDSYLTLYKAIIKSGVQKAYLITYDDQVALEAWKSKDVMNSGVGLPTPELSLIHI